MNKTKINTDKREAQLNEQANESNIDNMLKEYRTTRRVKATCTFCKRESRKYCAMGNMVNCNSCNLASPFDNDGNIKFVYRIYKRYVLEAKI